MNSCFWNQIRESLIFYSSTFHSTQLDAKKLSSRFLPDFPQVQIFIFYVHGMMMSFVKVQLSSVVCKIVIFSKKKAMGCVKVGV